MGNNALRKTGKASAEPGSITLRDDAPFIEASWLYYYHDGLNQSDIANRMQISRASVVNYLSEARKRGWVRVYLDHDVFPGHQLSDELCKTYGLQAALVVPDDQPGVNSEVAQ